MPKPKNWQRQLIDELEGGTGKPGDPTPRIVVPVPDWADAVATIGVYAEAEGLSCDFESMASTRVTLTGEGHDEHLGDCEIVRACFVLVPGLVPTKEAPHA